MCFLNNNLVLLFDNSYKRIDELLENDQLMCFGFLNKTMGFELFDTPKPVNINYLGYDLVLFVQRKISSECSDFIDKPFIC